MIIPSYTQPGTERRVLRGESRLSIPLPVPALRPRGRTHGTKAISTAQSQHDEHGHGISLFLLWSHVHSDDVFRLFRLPICPGPGLLLFPHFLRIGRRQGEIRGVFLTTRIATRSAYTSMTSWWLTLGQFISPLPRPCSPRSSHSTSITATTTCSR